MGKRSSPLLEMRAISKSYPGVKALDSVDMDLHRGEVLALVGENGAGKTTLIKILGGVVQKDNGAILVNGNPEEIESPRHARHLGFSFIHQELELVPSFNTIENLYLGLPYPKRGVFIDWSGMRETTDVIMRRFGFDFNIRTPVKNLKTSCKWMASIMRAFIIDSRLIVFDEPTVALEEQYIKKLFDAIRTFKEDGKGIVYISHRLDEVFEVADRILVLRNGKNMVSLKKDETNREELIECMTGRKIVNLFPERRYSEEIEERGSCLLSLEKVSRKGMYEDVTFKIRKGEIVGLFGLAGSGITELALGIFGVFPFMSGDVRVLGRPVSIRKPIDSINRGIVLIPDDRLRKGLVLSMSVKENITLPVLRDITTLSFVRRKRERAIAGGIVQNLRIATPGIHQRVRNLSGGNKQKVSLGKWLTAENELFVFNEPTAGIDVGARSEIYRIIERIAQKGRGILIVSFNLPEIIGLADRIIVMREGRVVGEVRKRDADEKKILRLAYGVAQLDEGR